MIGLRLDMGQYQELRPPMCETALPKLTELLDNKLYELAVRVMAWNKDIDRYANLVDFMFVEVLTTWRYACFRYYDGKGPNLKNHPKVTEEMLSTWDDQLCSCVLSAYECAFDRSHSGSWTRFHKYLMNTHIKRGEK